MKNLVYLKKFFKSIIILTLLVLFFYSFGLISDKKNVPFMGWQFEENFFWPKEKPTWTSAALIIAADSIYDFSDGSDIFTRNQL